MDAIAIIAAAVNLIALGGFAWWIVGWLRSLKGAVDAQKETIAAQKEFIQGLQTVLDATDTPKMLERIKAYKKFVDQEKEAALTQVKKELIEEENKSAETLLRQLNHVGERLTDFADLVARLMPFVPPGDREDLVGFADLSMSLTPRLKDQLIRLAQEAPDLSRPEARRGLVYVGYLIKGTSKKSD